MTTHEELAGVMARRVPEWARDGQLNVIAAIEPMIAAHCAEREQAVADALDSYWRTQPDVVSAARAVVADANKFRIHAAALRDELTRLRDCVGEADMEIIDAVLEATK